MSIRGLIFDYGGVLWDMRWDLARAIEREHQLGERAIPDTMYGSDTWKQLEVGVGDRAAWLREAHAALESHAGRELPPLHEQWRAGQRWIAPNIDLIRSLRPLYKTAVLSNADHTLAERFRSAPGVWELFDAFVCSADVGMAKPDARIYALAAERLGLAPEECVFIDDLDRNVDAARAAGMQAIHFRIDLGHALERQFADLGIAPDA